MPDKRIFDLTETTSLLDKWIQVDASFEEEAQRFSANSLLSESEGNTFYYPRAEADSVFLTPAEGDAAYYPRAEADGKFLTELAADLLYYPRSEADSTFLTPAEGDALFLTPAEGDIAYYPRAEADTKFLDATEGDASYVKLVGAETVAGVKTWSDDAIFESFVGIGTSTMSRPLTVSASKAAEYVTLIQNTAADGHGLLIYVDNVSATSYAVKIDTGFQAGVFTIRGDGATGIGYADPQVMLEVADSFIITRKSERTQAIYLYTDGSANWIESRGTTKSLIHSMASGGNYVWQFSGTTYATITSGPDMLILDAGSSSGGLYIDTAATGQAHIIFGATGGQGRGKAGMYYSDNADQIFFQTGGTDSLVIHTDGKIRFNLYGGGGITGTGTYALAVDSGGNIIEIPIGGGSSPWDTTTQPPDISYIAGLVGIGTATPTGSSPGIALNVTVEGSDESFPTIRLERTAGGTKTPAAYEQVIGSDGTWFLREVGANDPILIKQGAPGLSLVLAPDGVGIGISAPTAKLHVQNDTVATYAGTFSGASGTYGLYVSNSGFDRSLYVNGTSNTGETIVANGTGTRVGFALSSSSVEGWSWCLINPAAAGYELNAMGFTELFDGVDTFHLVIARSNTVQWPLLPGAAAATDLNYDTTTKQMYYVTSDAKLKQNIKPWNPDALGVLASFEPKTFEYISEPGRERTGWIAQEGVKAVKDMFPIHPGTKMHSLASVEILPYYHKAILQLKAEIEELKSNMN